MVLKLEVFAPDQPSAAGNTVVLDTMLLEETKLSAYDSGYAAGWEDATAAQSEDQNRVRADLARNLQSLGFSYHEARAHVLKALEPLLRQITGQLLPELARDSLAPMVLEILMPLAEKLADTPITLVLNPAARPAVEALLEQATGLPLTLQEEPSLSEGQIYLRLGAVETQVNLDRAVAEITAAVRGFFETPKKDKSHG